MKIKQLFINLIKNGIESMENGKVMIHTHEYDHAVEVKVTDYGQGIPEDIVNKIGEPFFTTKENGTGLGLLISNQIIESHQGKMFIESIQGIGTTVTVILPKPK
ncbi:HAMP domain-containing sensor histidine kinase [Bacillus sp. 31A1R]|uniref:histidine kinase n=1 Tax=Robertmurraya mangrovi TaxID=3098077 RepID=A0ABU5IWH4_9BACI|nr:HAMP domain-containing sensor histidine kinase [Bacillus sp. 31A1R]MDZ5471486.1 HAMP domain-containing sensor histidine kinase [Bacillus sp. 31A1R]